MLGEDEDDDEDEEEMAEEQHHHRHRRASLQALDQAEYSDSEENEENKDDDDEDLAAYPNKNKNKRRPSLRSQHLQNMRNGEGDDQGKALPLDDNIINTQEHPEAGGDQNGRYPSRNRRTLERFNPVKQASELSPGSGGGGSRRSIRRSGRTSGGISTGIPNNNATGNGDTKHDSQAAGDTNNSNERFSRRYSVRERKTIERFVPTMDEPSYNPNSNPSNHHHHHADHVAAGGRRQYSFRDRTLVTLKDGGGGGGGSRKRSRYGGERSRLGGGGGRLGRTNSKFGEYSDGDELPLELTHHYQPRGTGGGGGGRKEPWQRALSSVAAAANHLNNQPWGGPSGYNNNNNSNKPEKAANAEITPLEVDTSLSWDQVGGLEHYVRALKEMIFLPLVYPELFERFKITPPRGVLFYGPPGTGKTLVARALAAHASRGAGQKVSFFMRKGADILSKWVGEAERQLRLLFEEAQKRAPSIIFFDEIDGLAPVRSSKQDQIHNSIVSTLLALMDGLDSRGQVVVIGATNRVDALDGALRRPGRFDRELVFPLPNEGARKEILRIHTSKWASPPNGELVEELASAAVGYCGADLKALCTEASLAALRRKFPQIYDSEKKLLVDPGGISVEKRDFLSALTAITPASHRSAAAHARPLPTLTAPLLKAQLQHVLARVQRCFPPAAACFRSGFGFKNPAAGFTNNNISRNNNSSISSLITATTTILRPRLLICGSEGNGQAHLGPALLYALEGLPVHSIGLPSLLSDASARSAEEALVHAVVEARRAAPAVLFLPHLQVWWDTAPASLRATLWTLLADLPPDLPLLLLATADCSVEDLDPGASAALFGARAGEGYYEVAVPGEEERRAFFSPTAEALAFPPSKKHLQDEDKESSVSTQHPQPVQALPLAPDAIAAAAARKKAEETAAARQIYEHDQAALRALRVTLREVTTKLLRNRRWELFWMPPDPEDDPEYWNTVTCPMDLATILSRVDGRKYNLPSQYLADMALIPRAERELHGDDPRGYREISKACALEDEARSLVAAAVPDGLVEVLESIEAKGGAAAAPVDMPAEVPLALDGRNKGRGVFGDGSGGGKRTTRLREVPIDDGVVHQDPEAERRRIMALKRAAKQQEEQENKQEGGEGVEEQLEQQGEPPLLLQQQQSQKEQVFIATDNPDNIAPSEIEENPANKEMARQLCDTLVRSTAGWSCDRMEGLNARFLSLVVDKRNILDRRSVVEEAMGCIGL
jgi:SpoVK/Ycf46/Vps4 family AAA+-type ATPase